MTRNYTAGKTCQEPNCTDALYARTYCQKHYNLIVRNPARQVKRSLNEATPRRPKKTKRPCKFEDCGYPEDRGSELCTGHRLQMNKHGKLRPIFVRRSA